MLVDLRKSLVDFSSFFVARSHLQIVTDLTIITVNWYAHKSFCSHRLLGFMQFLKLGIDWVVGFETDKIDVLVFEQCSLHHKFLAIRSSLMTV